MGKMSGSHCLVMGCRNRQLLNQTNTRSYFRFPRDPDMCKQWVEFCNRPELWKKYAENGPEYLYKSSRICSDHFLPSDFNNPNLFSQGLKKGSVPTQYPASKEPKNRYSIGGIGLGLAGGGGGGGGGVSGNNSPPNHHNNINDSESPLIMPMSTKRPLSSQPSAQQPVAKQRRSVPAALNLSTNNSTNNSHATVSGALAGLIQRQQLKEQQRKAFAAALQLQHRPNQQQTRSLLASLKQKPNSNNNNNNNNNNHISSNNNNNNTSSGKLAAVAAQEKLEDERGYGINYVDMDGGDSSEYESGLQSAVEKELAAYKQLQQMKAVKAAAAVIPASLKAELTVTPAVNHSTSNGHSLLNGTINYKEKYEQTLKELFACRKIVKNQNNAIKQLQGEIDFLNQLLKEK
ncbi:ras guanine nucleotide exchange factor P-like isoform X1 [Wyeomyia smithii]|uniref:ras guanine nucleotide exchange factor P-like isoform X1 n=1 Tax=Wyeomyia smithii TaxID=174621 RepID=UPI0024681CEA|nr:ras guanine nucleotide exchange factor P-like isoform X1 [Wyeomyia smithii]